jgi:hypothetical protein
MERQFQSAQPHLTDEQFSELLLGSTPSAIQEHLKACSQCSDEAERVSAAIGSFSQQSRLWAECRIAARPILAPVRPPVFEWIHRPQAWTAAALAIALAAGIGISGRNHRSPTVASPVASVNPAPQVSPEALKADNELLSAIDGELRADESTPAIAYGLNTASHGERNRSAKRTINE